MTLESVASDSRPPFPSPPLSATPRDAAAWSPLRRVIFRFAAIYWPLFCLRADADMSASGALGHAYVNAWTRLCVFVARHVLRIGHEIATHENGSGDRIIDYVSILIIAAVATLGAVVWTLLDRRRQQYNRLHDWLRVIVRYSLGLIMLDYGLVKVFPLQFPVPDGTRLLHTYGESSPMRLLWTFMGASPAYVMFAGVGETVGAMFVLFRRTTTLGALILSAVLSNVVMVNFCYDVDVKISSAHYLAMSIFLLMPDVARLGDVLIRQRPTQPLLWRRTFASRRRRLIHHVIKYGLIGTFVFMDVRGAWRDFRDDAASDKPWIDGAWLVKRFARDGQDLPAIVDDKTRWRFVNIDRAEGKEFWRWHNMDGSRGPLFTITVDEGKRLVVLTSYDEPQTSYTLTLSRNDVDNFTIEGKLAGEAMKVELARFRRGDALLLSHGFHFISEVPFNR
jgi:uncharacterized membrane protein YphA (DoxX/SURF4 family)